jgi:anti-sigma factor RsiW
LELTHEVIAGLLGAYARDAVDETEAQIVESHLAVCPRCRDEVRDHREVASLLGYSGAPAPPGMWDRLAASLEDPAPAVDAPRLAPVRTLDAARARRRVQRFRAVVGVAAAVVVVLAVAGGLRLRSTIQDQDDQIGRMATDAALSQAAAAASTSPGSRVVHLASSDRSVLADAVITPGGTGYLWNVQLPQPAAGRAYQLWAIVGDDKVSVGVLSASARVHRFAVPAGSVGALAVTDEPMAGSVQPTTAPVLLGTLPS